MRTLSLVAGLLLLFLAEILRVYFIMPMPGSQQSNTIDTAYFIGKNIVWFRLIAVVLIIYPALLLFKTGNTWKKIVLALALVIYGLVFYLFNYQLEADKMFYQPGSKQFAAVDAAKIGVDKLVLGVMLNGQAKAYPIQYIGYHHQVADTIGHIPVIVTYCTVCRTGRVFSPEVNGKTEKFRLVGMDHFNAMFEDNETKSWWRQATGEAIVGPLKGKSLREIPSAQLTLAAWQQQYPTTLVMLPDTNFKESYEKMAKYDKGLSKSDLTKRDSGSWKMKSWVVGIDQSGKSKAYDWNQLVKDRLIQDSMPGLPIVITLENDTASFHAFNRTLNGSTLQFRRLGDSLLNDLNTGSTWQLNGFCINGTFKGQQLTTIQAYQEFWHSWRTFHPVTDRYMGNK